LYAVDFAVISWLTTLVLVALLGLLARPQHPGAVHARPLADRRDVRTLADLVNRVALSILGAGTAISSVLLLGVHGGATNRRQVGSV
jgi:hypothetical protein